MRRTRQHHSPTRGFTLAELAVVLVIVALLFASAFVPLSTQLEVRNTADTRKQLEDLKEALIGFALSQGRLPCPADPAIATGAANAGIERAACNGNTLTGVVPWATLGLREADAWGRRYTYRVTADFADAIAANTHGCIGEVPNSLPTMSSYALCAAGDMTVNTRDATSKTTSVIAEKVPALIISHGRDGYGASQPTAVYMPDPPATNADETTNKTVGTIAFISRDRTDDSSGCSDTVTGTPSCEFDDIVAWVPLTTLIARTAAAGRLP